MFGRKSACTRTPEYLIVGLGNPGREYEFTRHNAGFLFIDALAQKMGLAGQTPKISIAVRRRRTVRPSMPAAQAADLYESFRPGGARRRGLL